MTSAGIGQARSLLQGAQRIAVLTGAGISTDSGIPDFRGPQGLWTRDPDAEKYSSIDFYLSDPELRVRAWQFRLSNPVLVAKPNAGHTALLALERSGKLLRLVTQNIDGLHLAAGTSPELLVEAHGNTREAVCTSCTWRGPMSETLERVRAGESDPACSECGGILKSATVFFGQSLDPDCVQTAFDAAASCDLLVCLGTTLAVYPVAEMVPIALGRGTPVLILNAERTEFDDSALVIRGSLSELLPEILSDLSKS